MAYKKYEGGDDKLDKLLKGHGENYEAARKAGDADGMRAANDAANMLRNEYGYAAEYADKDIDAVKRQTGYYQKDVPKRGGGGYAAPEAPSYSSRYGDQIDSLLEEIMGRDPFTYDPERDPTYKQYEESYTRNGKRAMQDTLGQVSARTGGLASSYAASASQQSYNNYMDALADKIPELRQLAYEMYVNEGNQKRGDLSMLMGLEQGEYGKYRDLLGQYNADRSFGYGVYADEWNRAQQVDETAYQRGRDQVADQRYVWERDYQVGRDQVADQWYEDETAYGREQDELKWSYQKDADAYDRALQMWQITGTLDEEGAKVLGLPAGTKTSDYHFKLAQLAKGSGSGGKKEEKEEEAPLTYQTMFDQGIETEGDAYLYLAASGYNHSQAERIAKEFAGWAEEHGTGDGFLGDRAQRLRMQLGTIPGLTEVNKVSIIQDALEHGGITEREADFLLNEIGY